MQTTTITGSTTITIAIVPLTTVFTPPDCSTSWTLASTGPDSLVNSILLQNAISHVTSCYPPGFSNTGRAMATHVFSPRYCPMGYTSAELTIDGPTTAATCCPSYVTLGSNSSYLPEGLLNLIICPPANINILRGQLNIDDTYIPGTISTLITAATPSTLMTPAISTAPTEHTTSIDSTEPDPPGPTALSPRAKARIGIGAAALGLAVLS
ncbi:hypothetical protein AARAC_001932 [Aspergillus arachidicola]|uniref:Uncharacterized protein n=1 Tax=Aspergillus arachidicola TaxID=656916 RepID=A0A2G7GBV2_9EURO|nr:hypothetical protein AARAC_001932 [Aspergillus arachidicola]